MSEFGPVWYPLSGMRRANVRINVIWSSWMGTVAYIRHPKNGKYMWATFRDGDPVWLPNALGRDWNPKPDAWQPLPGSIWPDALPPPLKIPADRFVRIDNAGRRAERYDAARAAAVLTAVDDDEGKEWWRDATNIRYEPPGEVTATMCEGRLMRALAHCGFTQGLTLESRTTLDALVDAIEERERAMAEDAPTNDYRAGFVPNAKDISDFTEAMSWWAALNHPDSWSNKREAWSINLQQKILLWRAQPLPWTFLEIAQKQKLSESRPRQLYHAGLKKCLRAANRQQVHPGSGFRDRLTEIREGNRASRNR